jgi:hypothetical protein
MSPALRNLLKKLKNDESLSFIYVFGENGSGGGPGEKQWIGHGGKLLTTH